MLSEVIHCILSFWLETSAVNMRQRWICSALNIRSAPLMFPRVACCYPPNGAVLCTACPPGCSFQLHAIKKYGFECTVKVILLFWMVRSCHKVAWLGAGQAGRSLISEVVKTSLFILKWHIYTPLFFYHSEYNRGPIGLADKWFWGGNENTILSVILHWVETGREGLNSPFGFSGFWLTVKTICRPIIHSDISHSSIPQHSNKRIRWDHYNIPLLRPGGPPIHSHPHVHAFIHFMNSISILPISLAGRFL